MSVITFPRRSTTRPPVRPVPAAPRRETRPAPTTRRRATPSRRTNRFSSPGSRSIVIVVFAVAVALVGSMVVASRQIQIHQLQGQLLQVQSTYAQQVGSLTNVAAPSQIARQAGALHLVDPVSVTQVSSSSLDVPLPLPRFVGYAPVTSRTNR